MIPLGAARRGGRSLLFLALPVLLGQACGQIEEPPAAPSEAATPASRAPGGAPSSATRMPPRRSAWVIFAADTVVAEVARTPEERERGLMNRSQIPEGTGMLFIYPEEEILSFWMSNTYVALDVAYLDASLRVVDIEQMEPESTEIHSSPRPVMFGLEVPKGWFAAHGVQAGDQAELVLGPL